MHTRPRSERGREREGGIRTGRENTERERNSASLPLSAFPAWSDRAKCPSLRQGTTDSSSIWKPIFGANSRMNQMLIVFTVHCPLEVGRFLKIRNCELGFLLPLSQMRNCESENDSFFDSFLIPLAYDSGSNAIKITKNVQ